MPTCSWPSLTFAFAVLYVILLIYNHYTFPAPISSPWSSCCSETVVLVQQGLDLPQSRRTAKDLRQVGNTSLFRSSTPCSHQSQDGASTMEVSLRSPQQEGCPHMCFVQVWFYTSTTGMAVGPDHMAQLGSTTKSEDTTCTKCQVYKFESNGSHRSHRSNRSHRGGESSSKQPKEAHNQPSRRQRRSKKSTNTFRGDAADGPSSWFQEPTWSSNLPRLQSVPTSTPRLQPSPQPRSSCAL